MTDACYPKAVLFDLDGTLIDSAPDLAAACNELLGLHGLSPLTIPQVTRMIGNGVEKLVERAFTAAGAPLGIAELKQALTEMAPIYLRHTSVLTKLMPGVRGALATLHVRHVAMGVVTNKPQAATRAVLNHFGLTELMRAIIGGDAVVNKKPAPDALFLALDKLHLYVGDAVMVGDSASDVGAARAAGMRVIIVKGGYTSTSADDLGADLVLDTMAELPDALGRLTAQ